MRSSSRIVRAARVAAPVLLVMPAKTPEPLAPTAAPPESAEVVVARAAAQAEQLLRDAEVEAAAILARARSEADQLRAEAHAQGLAAGQEDGRQQATTEMAEQVEQLRRLALAAADERIRIELACEHEMVALALAVAGRIVREQSLLNPDMVWANVRSALDRVGAASDARVLLHPDDLAIVEQFSGAQADGAPACSVTYVADAAVERGGCLVEVGAGTVDARVPAQLAEAIRFFESMLVGA